MKNLLFPHIFQPIGWIMFVPSVILGALIFFKVLAFAGLTSTIVNDCVIIGIALGALFIVCSREKGEDEMTRSLRLASLLNSIYVYMLLLVTNTLLLNGVAFLEFTVLNLVLLPIIFVFIFRMEICRYNKMSENEEQD